MSVGPSPAQGSLYVVSTPIGNLGDLSERARRVLATVAIVACEDTRRTGRLYDLLSIEPPRLVALHAHNERERTGDLIERLLMGDDVALVSDAGTPLVSDPGAHLVASAIAASIAVVAVPGASAVLAALVASGFSTERWTFEGFLPRKGHERARRLEAIAANDAATVCYEAPGRVAGTLDDLAQVCGGARRVAVGRELTKIHEQVWRGDLAAAAAWARANALRGEVVIVVSPAPPLVRSASEDVERAVEALLSAGLSRRDATTAVTLLLEVPKREAYDAALRLRPEGNGAVSGS